MSFGQGGPSWGPGESRTPDWAALADESAARGRRKKWLLIGGGALATAAVAAIVASPRSHRRPRRTRRTT